MHTLACSLPPAVTQSPEPLSDAWRRAKHPNMLLLCFLPPLSLPSAVLHNPNSVGVTEEFCPQWARDLRTQSHLFTGASQTRQAQREPPFDGGEPWKLALTTRPGFSVSLCPESHPSPADARGAAKDRGVGVQRVMRFFFQGGPLIDWRETERPFLSDAQGEC